VVLVVVARRVPQHDLFPRLDVHPRMVVSTVAVRRKCMTVLAWLELAKRPWCRSPL
jgi:hypothetical protein